MEFCLRTAYAHGTAAIRTHIDSVGPQTEISWPVVAEARERWRGRIELQATPLFHIDFALDEAHMRTVERMLDAHGSNILGAVTYMVPRLREGLDALFTLAERKGWDLDFHVDESADPAARSLGVIAETAIARRFPGRILAGHCCSLPLQEPDEQKRTIELVAKAGISVVSLPMCNMFLQDRQSGRTPRWRGVTAVHELKEAGRQRPDRQRQCARSVLRLRRSRHAGSLARGRERAPSRLSVRRLGERGAGGRRPRRWGWTSAPFGPARPRTLS